MCEQQHAEGDGTGGSGVCSSDWAGLELSKHLGGKDVCHSANGCVPGLLCELGAGFVYPLHLQSSEPSTAVEWSMVAVLASL